MEQMEIRNEPVAGFLAGPIVDSRWEDAWFLGGLEPGARWELMGPPVSICADCGSQSAGGGHCPPSGHPQACPPPPPPPSAGCPPPPPPPAPGKKAMAYLF